jgi:hypothetical protein
LSTTDVAEVTQKAAGVQPKHYGAVSLLVAEGSFALTLL